MLSPLKRQKKSLVKDIFPPKFCSQDVGGGAFTIEHDSDVKAESKTGRLSKASVVIYELRCS